MSENNIIVGMIATEQLTPFSFEYTEGVQNLCRLCESFPAQELSNLFF